MNNNPIGVFDSGVGGLSVLYELQKILPDENYIYYGDTINLPYGNKTKEELIQISENIFDYFKEAGVKAVVMACNTTSATVYDILKYKYDYKIYPIVQMVSKHIAEKGYNKVGVFATQATINSHAYRREITKYSPKTQVYETACPKWVHIVENELQKDKSSIENVRLNLESMQKNNVDKIILGCTHYPYLTGILKQFADEELFINPAQIFAGNIKSDLLKSGELREGKQEYIKFYVSSNPNQFMSAARQFYNVTDAKELKPILS